MVVKNCVSILIVVTMWHHEIISRPKHGIGLVEGKLSLSNKTSYSSPLHGSHQLARK